MGLEPYRLTVQPCPMLDLTEESVINTDIFYSSRHGPDTFR